MEPKDSPAQESLFNGFDSVGQTLQHAVDIVLSAAVDHFGVAILENQPNSPIVFRQVRRTCQPERVRFLDGVSGSDRVLFDPMFASYSFLAILEVAFDLAVEMAVGVTPKESQYNPAGEVL